jgi:hypothetical protein
MHSDRFSTAALRSLIHVEHVAVCNVFNLLSLGVDHNPAASLFDWNAITGSTKVENLKLCQ